MKDKFQLGIFMKTEINEKQKFCYNYHEVKELAESYGYKVIDKVECGVIWYGAFTLGVRNIWSLTNGRFQTADLIDGSYTNHKPCSSLEEALSRPL